MMVLLSLLIIGIVTWLVVRDPPKDCPSGWFCCSTTYSRDDYARHRALFHTPRVTAPEDRSDWR